MKKIKLKQLKFKLFLIPVFALISACHFTPAKSINSQQQNVVSTDPNRTLLPEQFPIYVLGTTVSRLPPPGPFPGFAKKILPTDNTYSGYPGCYIACYSHDKINGVYPVTQDIYVMGQVRIHGHYQQRVCVPTGYENKDISELKNFKKLCQIKIKTCEKNNCWAGGDTGGWFNIHQ